MILTAIILIVCGILIKYGKMYSLIAGYNTMSKEKQGEYDIKRIAALMAHIFFVMALVILIGYFLADWYENPQIEIIALFSAVFIGIPYLLIASNSKKYRNK